VKALVEACVSKYGRLDIAFNNAGYFMDPRTAADLKPGPVHEMSLDHWRTIIDTNASGTFYSMRHEIPVMLRQGGGVIVNMASVSGHAAFEGMSGYAASKHAVVGLTKVAAVELAPKNIRVNSISPLAVDTPMIRDSLAFFGVSLEQAAQSSPMKRINTTDEMARAVMFLASDDASSMTGMDLDVTGAFLAK
jgi:NAD(P)-dependent dehydrogenase (short-subunit alcohol dehydrogenase family)